MTSAQKSMAAAAALSTTQKGMAAASLPSTSAQGLDLNGSRAATPLAGALHPVRSKFPSPLPATSRQPPAAKPPAAAAPDPGSPFASLLSSLSQNDALLRERKARAYSASASNFKSKRSSSVPRASATGSDMALSLLSTSNRASGTPTRPVREAPATSYNAQLVAGFDSTMAGLMESITSRSDERSAGPSLAKFMARNFVAGRLQSAPTSAVDVCEGALQYKFRHPRDGPVRMVMYFKDMSDAQLDMQRMSLRFHVCRALRYFGSDYDPNDASHTLSMQLFSASEMAQLQDLLLTRVRDLKVV